jgi:AcrR family transcriptional regulator
MLATLAGMSPERHSIKATRPGQAPRSPRADAQRNHDALLSAARRLFDERGPDVPLDEVAKSAKVANATLYRHFATRAELIVAVYAEEVTELERLGDQLLDRTDSDQALQALTDWLRVFVRHIATKRDLALAIPDDPSGKRGVLFAGWHVTMHTAAARLLTRAKDVHAVRADLNATDLLALASGIALTGLPATRLDRLLDLARDGYRS